MAKTSHFQCRGPGFDPWSGNLIPYAATKSSPAKTKDPACCNEHLAQPCVCVCISIIHNCIFVCIPPCLSEKAMAPHSSTLAWKIPWTEEPGRLQSMGLLRVGQD